MSEMWNTAKYRLRCCIKGSSFVMPFVFLCIFLRFMYSVKPVDVVSGCLISVNVIFLVMAWVAMSESGRENRAMEQVLELRVHKTWAYFAGKMLSLFIISAIMSLACALWPVVQNLAEGGRLFDRKYVIADFANSFILIMGGACSGAMVGSFFHPDLCRDRKTAVLLATITALVSDIQGVIVSEVPFLKYVLWVLPNPSMAAMKCGNMAYFDNGISVLCFGTLVIYAFIYGIAGSLLQYRKRT